MATHKGKSTMGMDKTYIVNNKMHDCFGNNVTLSLVHNFQVRVDQVANCFHSSDHLWIRRLRVGFALYKAMHSSSQANNSSNTRTARNRMKLKTGWKIIRKRDSILNSAEELWKKCQVNKLNSCHKHSSFTAITESRNHVLAST